MSRITDTHEYFWNGPFSNWDHSPLQFEAFGEKNTFSNSEQAFMWCKAKFFNDDETAEKILVTPNPRQNKQLGREVKNFNPESWTESSYDFMVAVNLSKFKQNESHRNYLLSTEDKIIVEASPQDKIWGIGLHFNDDDVLDESKWQGLNLLGKAVMDVRTKLK